MVFKYILNHIPTSSKKRSGNKLIPKYITVHSTANLNSTAKNERDWLTNPSNTSSAGWHVCVDESMAIEAIPLNENAWHATDGTNGTGNRKSVGVEICESGDREKTLRNAINVVTDLLIKFNLSSDAVKRHYDWYKGKADPCPRILIQTKRWDWFVNEIKKELELRDMDKCTVYLDDKRIGIGIIVDGRSYLPIRALEGVKYVVDDWNNYTKSVYLKTVK